jgi:hypothetical protein
VEDVGETTIGLVVAFPGVHKKVPPAGATVAVKVVEPPLQIVAEDASILIVGIGLTVTSTFVTAELVQLAGAGVVAVIVYSTVPTVVPLVFE